MKSRDEISAGGVVYRQGANGLEVLICKDAGYHRWVLPKGVTRKSETLEQTALREVEEVGVRAHVVLALDEPEKYIYVARGVRVFKAVHYFLMEYDSGSEAEHDAEMEDVKWVPFDTAIAELAYEGAKNVVRRCKEYLDGQYE
jgi:8-oxo-dGTP pyrophosphatase MutT (NUDIX family)